MYIDIQANFTITGTSTAEFPYWGSILVFILILSFSSCIGEKLHTILSFKIYLQAHTNTDTHVLYMPESVQQACHFRSQRKSQWRPAALEPMAESQLHAEASKRSTTQWQSKPAQQRENSWLPPTHRAAHALVTPHSIGSRSFQSYKKKA